MTSETGLAYPVEIQIVHSQEIVPAELRDPTFLRIEIRQPSEVVGCSSGGLHISKSFYRLADTVGSMVSTNNSRRLIAILDCICPVGETGG